MIADNDHCLKRETFRALKVTAIYEDDYSNEESAMKRLALAFLLATTLLVANKVRTNDMRLTDWPPTCFPPRCH
jgi:hypothetical protein